MRCPELSELTGPGELICCQARFTGHHVSREVLHDRVRFIARARELGIHPYAVITPSLDELSTELIRSGW
jgi:hypothetical protein